MGAVETTTTPKPKLANAAMKATTAHSLSTNFPRKASRLFTGGSRQAPAVRSCGSHHASCAGNLCLGRRHSRHPATFRGSTWDAPDRPSLGHGGSSRCRPWRDTCDGNAPDRPSLGHGALSAAVHGVTLATGMPRTGHPWVMAGVLAAVLGVTLATGMPRTGHPWPVSKRPANQWFASRPFTPIRSLLGVCRRCRRPRGRRRAVR